MSAPDPSRVAALGAIPAALECRAEVPLTALDGSDLGRVDLLFEDPDRTFCLLAELKLHSEYGLDQLPRYLRALDAIPAQRKALLAVTKVTPQVGEEQVTADPRWMGSVRWSAAFDGLRAAAPSDQPLGEVWIEMLDLLRRHGDFGPMDFQPDALDAWARRDEAEGLIRYFLGELSLPALAALRSAAGRGPDNVETAERIMRGHSQPVFPWRNRLHLKYAVLSEPPEERFRIQFLADRGRPYFTAEARYEHPKESLDDDAAVAEATARLTAGGIAHGNDGWGYYWTNHQPVRVYLAGAATLDRLLAGVVKAAGVIAESGLFAALAARTPTTPLAVSPPEDPTENSLAGNA